MKSTSESLLADLAREAGATRWTEFVSIYGPIIRCFLQKKYALAEADVDDLLQTILVEVVKMMRSEIVPHKIPLAGAKCK